MTETCVIYHHFESTEASRKNLLHFLKFGYRTDIDYFFVVAGGSSVVIPALPNIRVADIENKNLDFGGYSFAVRQLVPIDSYRQFLFVNSSVRGPFVPAYVDDWTRPLVALLTDDVGIAGSTINILNPAYEYSLSYQAAFGGRPPYSHVQTMCFALPRVVLRRLLADGFFDLGDWVHKEQVIMNAEVRLSQMVIGYGYTMKCLIARYNEIDYRQPHSDINPTSLNGDPVYRGALFGRTIHPFEAVFIKTNRELYTEDYLDSLAGNCYAPPVRPVVAVIDRVAGPSDSISAIPPLVQYPPGTPKTLHG